MSCLFEMDRVIKKYKTCNDMLGCIHANMSNTDPVIGKKFFGR